jgi:uncharacterized protein
MLAAAVFLLAGWVKGVSGMGLPTVVMAGLGLILTPVEAAALLVLPSLATNVWQFVAGPSPLAALRRLATMMLMICAGTAVGVGLLTSGALRWPLLALGGVLAAYALIGLFAPRLSVSTRAERWLSPPIGAFTGLLGGATGVFAVPGVPYLSALGFSKDQLVQALGLSFTVSTIALAVGLGAAGAFSADRALASAAAVVPALLGMFAGQKLRDRLDPLTFRRWFFIAMLGIGLVMVTKALLAS